MCSTKIMSVVEAETSRRNFLRTMGVSAVGIGITAATTGANAQNISTFFGKRNLQFEKVIDCTQVLEPNSPNYFHLNMEIDPLTSVQQNGYFVNRLVVPEHYGTHFDAPAHFIADGLTTERLRPEQLVGPLVIIDISERAETDPNAAVTVDDIEEWERRNGQIPRGALVAMYSNWAARWPTSAYLNADSTGTYHFPGFGGEVSQFQVEERDIIGVGVDSHSIDVGPSTTFAAHITILGAGKLGVEVLAGLDEVLRQTNHDNGLPFVFIGGLKTLHGSGSPVRALALV